MSDVFFELEPLDTTEAKSPDTSSVLRTAFGKKNRISMSLPIARPYDPTRFSAAADGFGDLGDDCLTVVSTTFSFVPDFGCAFIAADFSLEFVLRDGGQARVVDLTPRERLREEDYQSQRERKSILKGSVAPGLTEILAEAGRSATVEVNGKRKVRDIWAFGLHGAEAGWRFQSSIGHQLAGIYDDFEFVVRCPSKGFLQARVRIGAEIAVEDRLDHWATIAFGLDQSRHEAGGLIDIGMG